MGKVLEFLGLPFIEKELQSEHSFYASTRSRIAEADHAFLQQTTITNVVDQKNPLQNVLCDPIGHLINIAELEHARGASAEMVKGLFRKGGIIWEPIVAAMDFRPRTYTGTGEKWTAENLRKEFGAIVTKVGKDYHYQYQANDAPLWLKIKKAMICGAIGGDQTFAKKFATAYKVPPPEELDEFDGVFVLRHLLAGDDEQARAAAKRLKQYKPPDFPPELIEFPLGVANNDPDLLLKGLKALNTRFKSKWDEKKWRKRHEKIKSGEIRLRYSEQMPSWEEMLEEVRTHLFTMHWLLSPFALAFLNVARWRGMTSPFDQPKAFSEWVPLELCL